MIERVAKAIAEKTYGPTEGVGWGCYRDEYRDIARAAIAAMREPTEAMIGVGADKMPARGMRVGVQQAKDVFHAMIGEALKESERGGETISPNPVQVFGPPGEVAVRLLRLAAEIRAGEYPKIGALEDDRGIQVFFDGAAAS